MRGNDDSSGIDVSRWQGDIDWQTVQKNGSIVFVFAKATEGATGRDLRFKENWQGMKRQGMAAGAYHVVRGTSTPQDQAANILTVLRPAGFNHSSDRFALSIIRDDKLTTTEFFNRSRCGWRMLLNALAYRSQASGQKRLKLDRFALITGDLVV